MSLAGFDKYNKEIEAFENSKLYKMHYERFIDLLRNNPGKFISAKIERYLNLKGTQIRALVRYARCRHVPIASDGDGYWIAKSKQEYEQSIIHISERYYSLGFLLGRMQSQAFGDPIGKNVLQGRLF